MNAVAQVCCVIAYNIGDFDEVKLLSIIGQGSFGTVHRALWRGMMVAAKVIPVSLVDGKERAAKEVELCQLAHSKVINQPH